MAIVYDASADGGSAPSAASLTWVHVCGAGATLLRVGVRSTIAAAETVTGVTYNGVAMTKIASRAGDGVNFRCVSLWELANPAAGSHSVVVSAITSALQGASASYLGAGTQNAIGSGQGNGSVLAVSATTITPLSWVQGVFGSASQVLSAGGGTARRTVQLPPAGGMGLFDSDEPVLPAGLRNVQVTTPAATWINGVVAAIRALPPAPPVDISFDAASGPSGFANPVLSHSWVHTCGAGATLLRVGVMSSLTPNENVTGVTYNGIALTRLRASAGDGSAVRCFSIWELFMPPTGGAYTVVVTGTPADFISACCVSYRNAAGADVTGVITNTGTTVLNLSITPVTNRSWVQGFFVSGSAPLTGGAGTVTRFTSDLLYMAALDNGVAIDPPVPTTIQGVAASSAAAELMGATIRPLSSVTGGSGDLGIDLTTALARKLAGVSPDVTTAFRRYLDGLSIGSTKDLNTAIWHDLSGV